MTDVVVMAVVSHLRMVVLTQCGCWVVAAQRIIRVLVLAQGTMITSTAGRPSSGTSCTRAGWGAGAPAFLNPKPPALCRGTPPNRRQTAARERGWTPWNGGL